MNLNTTGKPKSPTILVVQNSYSRLPLDSSVLHSFQWVYVATEERSEVLLWIQQNQPHLIILDLPQSQIAEWGIITALRLDWLTRDIPVAVISDRSNYYWFEADWLPDLDYNACLFKPYSSKELEKIVCSLVLNPACLICSG